MANIASIVLSLALSGTNLQECLTANVSDTLTGTSFVKDEPVIATTETAIALPGIATPGWVLVKNLDGTNYVELTCVSGVYGTVKVPPGRFAMFFMDGASLFGKANTAPVQLEVFALPQ
jgi:hypothetical protein